MSAEPCPEARFIEASLSVLHLRVSRSGIILAANRHAETLIGGEPLAGRPWETILPISDGNPSFPDWIADPSVPRVLNVRTASSIPQTLRMTVEPVGEDFVLLGEVDSAEQAALRLDLLELNSDLNAATRDLAVRNADLAADIRQRDDLLRERHHRVKNNLAMITSLMRITAGRSVNPETRAVLQDMQARIHSVTVLNETLARTARYTTVDLADYLGQIATHLFRAQASEEGHVRLHLDLHPVEVAATRAIPCGLIVNELITNSLKYAFPEGRGGEVRVSLRPEPGRATTLCVGDDGIGLPEDFAARSADSLGLQLVGDLVRQIGGTLSVGPGARFTISFA